MSAISSADGGNGLSGRRREMQRRGGVQERVGLLGERMKMKGLDCSETGTRI